VANKTAGVSGEVLLYLSSFLLVFYFLGISAPGRATVSWLAQDEIHGAAEVGGVAVDPLGGSYVAVDLAVVDLENRPVVNVGGLEVVADSLLDKEFHRLLVREARVTVTVDEEGRVNLLKLKKHKEGPPSAPSGFRLDDITVNDSSVALETPFANVELGPVSVAGAASKVPTGTPQAEVKARIDRLSLVPQTPEIVQSLAGLFGPDTAYEFGPVEGSVRFRDGALQLKEVTFDFPGSRAHLVADIDVLNLTGRTSLTVVTDGRDAGALYAQRDAGGWALSLLVNTLDIPGGGGDSVKIPRVEMTGLSLNAVPEHFTFKLNRLAMDDLRVDAYSALGFSTSSTLHFEGRDKMDGLVSQLGEQDGLWLVLDSLASQWRKGNLTLSILSDRLRRGEKLLASPFRLKVSGGPDDKGVITLEASLNFHPHGGVRAQAVVEKVNREGRRPYAVTIEIDALNTKPVLAIVDPPGILAGMLKGTLSGRLSFNGNRISDSIWHVTECRFALENQGGGIDFLLPEKTQNWDMAAGIGFSFFAKEITFGAGKLKMVVKERKVNDG